MTKNSDLGIREEHPQTRTVIKTDTRTRWTTYYDSSLWI